MDMQVPTQTIYNQAVIRDDSEAYCRCRLAEVDERSMTRESYEEFLDELEDTGNGDFVDNMMEEFEKKVVAA
jgi:hypothetical protein